MLSEPDDAQITSWALAAAAGDRAAAAAFIRATQQVVIRFLAHLVDPGDAEDLAQETYLRAMQALPRFVGRSSAKTWLLAIARRVAVTEWSRVDDPAQRWEVPPTMRRGTRDDTDPVYWLVPELQRPAV